MVDCWQIRERITAKNRRFARFELQAQNNELPRNEERKMLSIDWRQNEGSYAVAFLLYIRDSHLSKTGPCWRLLFICESRISDGTLGARVLLEHRSERTLPTL